MTTAQRTPRFIAAGEALTDLIREEEKIWVHEREAHPGMSRVSWLDSAYRAPLRAA